MNCILCGATEQECHFKNVEDWEYQTYRAVDFTQCSRCRLIWQEPLPAPSIVPSFYPAQYRNFLPQQETLLSKLKAIQFRSMAALVSRGFRKNGKLLEIGFGNGQLLMALKDLGYLNLFGSDMVNASFPKLEAQGITVRGGNIEEAFPFDQAFDGIIMNNVFEHLLTPLTVLKSCREHLEKGGRLVLITPNANALELSIFHKYWAGFHSPRHIYLFNDDNVALLKERGGFSQIGVEPVSDPGQWAISLQNLLQDHQRTRLPLKNGLAPYTVPLSLLFALPTVMQNFIKRSTSMLCSLQA
jgi:SAM-dependent methyltransferase